MHKRNITYKTFDDPPQTVTETFYFNISEMDIVQMDMYQDDGMENFLRRIASTEDRRKLWDLIKDLILSSYGVRDPDMRGFIKTPEIRQKFEFSNAFNNLMLELMSDQAKLEAFILDVLPEEVVAEAKKSEAFQNTVTAAAAQATGVPSTTPVMDIPSPVLNEVPPSKEFTLPPQPPA